MKPHPRLLFASYHCLLDPTSGAAVGMCELLEVLAERKVPVQAFCGARMDRLGVQIESWLNDQHRPNQQRMFRDKDVLFSMTDCFQGTVPVTIYAPEHEMSDPSRDPTAAEIATFVSLYEQLLDQQRPDVVITYGGSWLDDSLIFQARRRGIKVVFWLRNFAYQSADLFTQVDAILVPSQFAADHYHRALGVDCTVIPAPINPARVVGQADPTERFVTFVNPVASKGAALFVRVAAELGLHRPDIPLLVVEGRGALNDLTSYGVDLSHANLRGMKNTEHPILFYRVSKLVLMPSLGQETFGRVALEAMFNGIPVLASDRGSLPEVLGDGGYLFTVPAIYTEHSMDVPAAAEVSPWVQTIIELWDDPRRYHQAAQRARKRATRFDPKAVLQQYLDFFRSVVDSPTES